MHFVLYFIEICGAISICGLIYIHFFIKVPSLASKGEKPSFWSSIISNLPQYKDSRAFTDLATETNDSYLQNVLKVERIFIYLLAFSAVCSIIVIVLVD